QCDLALADFDRVIQLQPQQSSAYFGRGLCQIDQKKIDQGVSDLDQVIKLQMPADAAFASLAAVMKSRIEASRGNLDNAIANIDEAIKFDPAQLSLRMDRASLWLAKGDRNKAQAD